MPTRISKVGNQGGATRTLKLEGTLTLAEARLLENVCNDLLEQSDDRIAIDLSAITFLDSESASVLRSLKESGVLLEGLDLFVQRMVDLVERSGDAQ